MNLLVIMTHTYVTETWKISRLFHIPYRRLLRHASRYHVFDETESEMIIFVKLGLKLLCLILFIDPGIVMGVAEEIEEISTAVVVILENLSLKSLLSQLMWEICLMELYRVIWKICLRI